MVQIDIKDFSKKSVLFNKLPVLFYAGMISDDPGFFYPNNRHLNFSEIIYIAEGSGRFIIDNTPHIVQKGDIIVYNKGVYHEERSSDTDPLKTYYCAVGDIWLNGMEEGSILPDNVEPVIHAGQYSYKIENCLSEIFEECYSQVIGYENICQNLLISLIILIIRIVNMQNNIVQSKEASISLKIKEYIDRNYTRNVSLNEIANTLYLSQHYISHIFKNETGDSPINYLIKLRIDEAKRLLAETNMTISDISSSIGYDNANYFNTLFKKVTGMSPGTYRKNH